MVKCIHDEGLCRTTGRHHANHIRIFEAPSRCLRWTSSLLMGHLGVLHVQSRRRALQDSSWCSLLVANAEADGPSPAQSPAFRHTVRPKSRNPRSSSGPRMTSGTMMSPSARRSLHHCSPRSEKMMRAEDKFITLKKKVCRPVSRRPSVMIERGETL